MVIAHTKNNLVVGKESLVKLINIIDVYKRQEKKMLKNTPAGYKKEYPWLKEIDSLALANVQLNLRCV